MMWWLLSIVVVLAAFLFGFFLAAWVRQATIDGLKEALASVRNDLSQARGREGTLKNAVRELHARMAVAGINEEIEATRFDTRDN